MVTAEAPVTGLSSARDERSAPCLQHAAPQNSYMRDYGLSMLT